MVTRVNYSDTTKQSILTDPEVDFLLRLVDFLLFGK